MGGGHVSRPDFGMPQPDAAYPLTEFYLLAQQALEKSGSFMLPALDVYKRQIRPWKRWPMSGRSTWICLPPSYLKAFWLNRLMYTGVPSSSFAGTTQGQTVEPKRIFISSRILK